MARQLSIFSSNATYMHANSMFTRPLNTNYIIQLPFCYGQEHKCKVSQIWWIWSLFCTRVQWDTVFLNIKMSFVRCTIQATITQKTKEQVWFCKQSWQWGILIVFVLSRGIIFAKKYCHTWSSVQCSKEEANLRLFDYLPFILSTLRTQRDYFEENVTVLVFP